jgi:RNase P protein component
MLSKDRKLTRHTFPSYRDRRSTYDGKAVRVVSYTGTGPQKTLFSVVVAKKHSNNAVERHLFKRRALAALFPLYPAFDHFVHGKVVIFPLRKVGTIAFADIRADLDAFLLMQHAH